MANESELPEVIAAGVPVVVPIAYEPDYRTDTIPVCRQPVLCLDPRRPPGVFHIRLLSRLIGIRPI